MNTFHTVLAYLGLALVVLGLPIAAIYIGGQAGAALIYLWVHKMWSLYLKSIGE